MATNTQKGGLVLLALGLLAVGAALLLKKSPTTTTSGGNKSVDCTVSSVGNILSYNAVAIGFTNPIYHVDFGDGKTSDLKTGDHTYVQAGNYSFTVSVTESADATSVKTCTKPVSIVAGVTKTTVLVAYPTCSTTDKNIATLKLYNTLKSIPKLAVDITGAKCIDSLNIGKYDVILLVGGNISWNDCNKLFTGCDVFADLGFNNTTADVNTWCNSVVAGGSKIYGFGGMDGADTANVVDAFFTPLNGDGSNIASISCADIVSQFP